MSVNLVLLANSTPRNEMLYKGRESQPPEVVFEDGFGAEDAHVTQEWRGVD